MESLSILLFVIIMFFWALNMFRFLLYFFIAPLYQLRKKEILSLSKSFTNKKIMKDFKVSIVIPSWNEEVGIIKTIESILSTKYSNLEIIVIDDGSKDKTGKYVTQFLKKNNKRLRKKGKTIKYIFKKNGGKGSALNLGIKNATGNLVFTIDADTIFDKDAIINAVRYFYDETIDALAGNVKVANSKSFIGILQKMEYEAGFYFKRVHGFFMAEYIVGGAFGVFRRSLFEKYGSFDEVCKTEDIMFSTKLQSEGCNIFYAEDAIAYTEGASDFNSLAKQRLRWKKGRTDTFIKYKKLLFSRDNKCKKFLTYFLMPLAILFDFQLFLEPIFFTWGIFLLVKYLDFSMFLSSWLLMTFLICISHFYGCKKGDKKMILLAPFFWLMNYPLIFIEIFTVFKSAYLVLTSKDVVWQNWKRKGVANV